MRKKLLLTAFDAFGGESVNPAQEVLGLLPDTLAGVQLIKLVLPTVFGDSLAMAEQAITLHQPDAVLSLGQAGGRPDITVERVAINLMDASLPDNKGQTPKDRPVVPGGPAAFFSTLPVKAMVQAMLDVGVPASVSYTAGAYVCNQLMYGVLHRLAQEGSGAIAGFVHVPYLPQQAEKIGSDMFGLPLADIRRGVEAAVGAIAEEVGGIVNGETSAFLRKSGANNFHREEEQA